jgi:hypothetical protein
VRISTSAPTVRVALLGIAAAGLVAACGTPTKGPETQGTGAGGGTPSGPVKQQDEGPWREAEVAPPPFPKRQDLIEFKPRHRTNSRFFVDGSTLTVEPDRVVRFALVIRSSGGVDNVSFAGLKCRGREWKDYAYGRADGTWARNESAQWKPIPDLAFNDYQRSLADDYVCTQGLFSSGPVGSAKFIVRTLKSPPQLDSQAGRKDYSEQKR